MSETGLIRYDSMVRAIAECHAVDEVKDLRDKAIALERYAQQAMNMDAERQARQIRLRAEDKAGELTKAMEKAKPGPTPKDSPHGGGKLTKAEQLERAGISKHQAERWEKLNDVPRDVFEDALADPDEMPTTSGIIRKANGDTASQVDSRAVWVWGRLRDFERDAVLEVDATVLFKDMTETMQADVRRLCPPVLEWLRNLREAAQ